MLFNSAAYLIFLPIVIALFWLTPFKWRTLLLLVASYVFYMFWKPIYVLLMIGLTAANYFIGLAMERFSAHKKAWLIGGITMNLVMLCYFKYAYMTRDAINDLAKLLGLQQLPPIALEIILPLGISFFVFEFIHYLAEVYKGEKAVKGPLDFALFAAFFPTQIAGPIKRYQDFMPQLRVPQKVTVSEVNEGIELIVFGLFKKVVLADSVAMVVNRCYAHPEMLTGVDLWMAIYGFAMQVYFDFSGYSDIARGSAKLMGFKVPINFDLPFMAASFADFWRRWHVSLSSWLRDYLYFPFGGSKHGEWVTCRNIIITMTIAGLWHGAAPHFVVWGFILGSVLAIHRLWRRVVEKNSWLQPIVATKWFNIFGIFLTFNTFCASLVVFRAQDCQTAWMILGRMFGLEAAPAPLLNWQPSILTSSGSFIYPLFPVIILLFLIGQLICSRFRGKTTAGIMPEPSGFPLFKPAYLAFLVILLLVFSPDVTPQFIYFQF